MMRGGCYRLGILAGGCIVRPGGAPSEAAALLDEARSLLDLVEAEVRRLAAEVFALRAGQIVLALPLMQLGVDVATQAAAYEGLIAQLERFVRDVFGRVELRALAGDVDAARRLRDATARILGVSVTSSPARDVAANASRVVRDVTRQIGGAAGLSLVGVAAGAAVASALYLFGGRRG